ncbi:hypothetical protein IMCC3317_11770 [Kordia antarctica]|uniref:Uncharacterized protein n=1 Tax=Kordia antarctica TaxID=1218801 RepID=A0A7L4ZHC0_9FLAO|nr:class I lanthipeptide [Kordia antarctica]QHI35829.1 hypothetical protein IMCC3317_11770 [Kordia antarctica]
MKKKSLKSLALNKKSISSLDEGNAKGGREANTSTLNSMIRCFTMGECISVHYCPTTIIQDAPIN